MHGSSLIQTWLHRNCSFVHRARSTAVVKAVAGLLHSEKLTLTHVGRGVRGAAFEKHNIKCIDRLLGNRHLARERLGVYRAMAHWLLGSTERPQIIVDWSDCESGHAHLMLKAAVPVSGRALSIYEEVHPLRRYNSPTTHRRFLERLSLVVPQRCRPIIITDAGFRGPWFKVVESYGWDWVGRVRNMVKFRLEETGAWRYTRLLYAGASRRPSYLGRCWLSSKHPYRCHLHLYKALQRGPGRPRKRSGDGRNTTRARRLARDPWLLATSLSPKAWSARRIVKLYEKRMQIEETFRDLKGHRWGFGLQYARTRSTERLEILLLVATLATLATWLAGLVAKAKGWMRHFQANTVRNRAVLSVFFLGRQLMKNSRLSATRQELLKASRNLPLLVNQCAKIA